jgi:hypothetical protein
MKTELILRAVKRALECFDNSGFLCSSCRADLDGPHDENCPLELLRQAEKELEK